MRLYFHGLYLKYYQKKKNQAYKVVLPLEFNTLVGELPKKILK